LARASHWTDPEAPEEVTMQLRTRVDKVVWLRDRAEDGALSTLSRARAELDRAHERLALAAEAIRVDTRALGPVDLWVVEEDGHRRAVQLMRAAEADAREADRREVLARDRYTVARRDARVVRRFQQRRRAELAGELERREGRALDELATLRFNHGR
jgi:flagellar biosynthesis chaperone FliJ